MGVDVDAGLLQLHPPSLDARRNRGREVDLHGRIRKHDGADIAAGHDYGTLLGDGALSGNHRGADLGVCGDGRNDRRDVVAEQSGFAELAAAGDDPKTQLRRFVELHFDRRDRHQTRKRCTVIDVGSGSQRKGGQCAVHRSGVEIEHAEALRGRARNRRFASGGGAVDRDLKMAWTRQGAADSPRQRNGPAERLLVAKTRAVYFCSACGFESPRWLGRCPQCEAWNSFDERPFNVAPKLGRSVRPAAAPAAVPVPLREVGSASIARLRVGMTEFDAVLGGGIVPGSLTLVGGAPGAGKSTLLLQIAARLAHHGEVIYVCGEESAAQVRLRADRVLDESSFDRLRMTIYPETNLRAVLDSLERRPPLAVVVDSIQTVWLPESEAYAGSITQIRDCTQALVEFSKRTGCACFIVGHVTKDGAIAGPRLLEHLVDTVLYFEGEATGEYRILRAYKNRFGSIDEICVFTMHDGGLREIPNPSELFLGARAQRPSGSCVVASIVGSRPVLIEVQGLVGEATYGTPRRLANNLDQQRLAMIIAVLERRAGFSLGTHDVYASVAGGLRVVEPAADLGIALAIASSFRNAPIAASVAVFGEVGLSGEVRTVGAAERREAEARKLGYSHVISPANTNDIATAIREVLG